MISKETYELWFKFCVWILYGVADIFHTTYEAVNIWIFCIIGPIVFFTVLIVLLRTWQLKVKYKRLYKAKYVNPGQFPQ